MILKFEKLVLGEQYGWFSTKMGYLYSTGRWDEVGLYLIFDPIFPEICLGDSFSGYSCRTTKCSLC